MYELCTLKHAFKPEGFLKIMLKITEAKYEPIQGLGKKIFSVDM